MKYLRLLFGISLVCTPALVQAQGYPNGIRNGYNGSTGTTSPAPTSSLSGSPSNVRQPNRNSGAGQGHTEGAMGLTPQLQKELGINRQ
jgi:hypothetical protein